MNCGRYIWHFNCFFVAWNIFWIIAVLRVTIFIVFPRRYICWFWYHFNWIHCNVSIYEYVWRHSKQHERNVVYFLSKLSKCIIYPILCTWSGSWFHRPTWGRNSIFFATQFFPYSPVFSKILEWQKGIMIHYNLWLTIISLFRSSHLSSNNKLTHWTYALGSFVTSWLTWFAGFNTRSLNCLDSRQATLHL